MTTNAPFWEAAAAGRLVLPACGSCGLRFFPPAALCPGCGSDAWSWIGSTGAGEVYSHTTCLRPHVQGIEAPYVLAVVTLDDGWTLLTNIVSDGHLDVRTGARVAVDFEPRPDGTQMRPAPVFVLSPTESGETT